VGERVAEAGYSLRPARCRPSGLCGRSTDVVRRTRTNTVRKSTRKRNCSPVWPSRRSSRPPSRPDGTPRRPLRVLGIKTVRHSTTLQKASKRLLRIRWSDGSSRPAYAAFSCGGAGCGGLPSTPPTENAATSVCKRTKSTRLGEQGWSEPVAYTVWPAGLEKAKGRRARVRHRPGRAFAPAPARRGAVPPCVGDHQEMTSTIPEAPLPLPEFPPPPPPPGILHPGQLGRPLLHRGY
jgi:hypothetical protein